MIEGMHLRYEQAVSAVDTLLLFQSRLKAAVYDRKAT
jgi:hypothetical protein